MPKMSSSPQPSWSLSPYGSVASAKTATRNNHSHHCRSVRYRTMLQIEALHQLFYAGEVNEVHALRGIDLFIPSGQFVTVIGSNGAGKSTLFNVAAGLFPPSQ